MIWYQNSVCTITFLHLDSQLIIIKPFSHFFIPGACLNAWDFWGFFFFFFVFLFFFFFWSRFMLYFFFAFSSKINTFEHFHFFWIFPLLGTSFLLYARLLFCSSARVWSTIMQIQYQNPTGYVTSTIQTY